MDLIKRIYIPLDMSRLELRDNNIQRWNCIYENVSKGILEFYIVLAALYTHYSVSSFKV